MATMVWFILRIPYTENYEETLLKPTMESQLARSTLEENRPYARLQKRLLHCLSQHAETFLRSSLTNIMPQPCPDDEYHPALKTLDSNTVSPIPIVEAATSAPCSSGTAAASAWMRSPRRSWQSTDFYREEGASSGPLLSAPWKTWACSRWFLRIEV